MKKIIFALSAAVLLLTGCADSSSVQNTEQTTESTAAAQAETTAPETTAATDSAASAAQSTASQGGGGTEAQISGTTASQDSNAPAQTVTTAAAQSGAGSTASAVTTVSTAAAVKKPLKTDLSGIQFSGMLYEMRDCGNGRAVALCMGQKDRMSAYFFDTVQNRLLNTVDIDSPYSPVVGVTPQQELICAVFDTLPSGTRSTLQYYSLETGQCRNVVLQRNNSDTETLQYDPNTDTVYGIGSNQITAYDRSGRARTVHSMKADGGFYCNSFHAASGIAVDTEIMPDELSGVSLAAYDAASGSRLYSFSDYHTTVYSTKNALFCLEGTYSQQKKKTFTNAVIREQRTGKILNQYLLHMGQYELFTSEDTETAMLVEWNESDWRPTAVIPFDPVSGKRAKTGITLKKNAQEMKLCHLKDSGLWLMGVSEASGRNTTVRLSLIDPAQADSSKRFDKAYDYGTAKQIQKVGSKFEPLREITDRIRRKTGVQVQFGNEVLNADEPSGYAINSMESGSYWTVQDYRDNLLFLERQLDRYPAGFFEKLKHTNNPSQPRLGLRVLVVQGLVTQDSTSTFSAGGLAYQGRAWYNIAICGHMLSDTNMSIHHEIWHIVEDYLLESGNSVNYDVWDATNPDYFEYTNDFNEYDNHPEYGKYLISTYTGTWPNGLDKLYFSRDYSTVNQNEECATLIERVFDIPDYIPGGPDNGLELVNSIPHMKTKLGLLADAVRRGWGYVYWEEIFGAERAAA